MAATTLADRWSVHKYKTYNWLQIAGMVARHGPFDTIRDLRRYPWIAELLKINQLTDRLVEGRSGVYREAVASLMSQIAGGIIETLDGIFHDADNLILHEDLVPPEIFRAMGLSPWMVEGMGVVVPMLHPQGMEAYIDIAENDGTPPDACSLPKTAMGMAIQGQMPQGKAIVTSNMPCDGGLTSYTVLERETKLPTYWLDAPFHFQTDRAIEYFAAQLKDMITWVEGVTPGRIDWDELRAVCERRNQMVEHELDLWEMVRHRPAPVAAEIVYLSHLWAFNFMPGMPSSVKMFETMSEFARINLENGVAAVEDEQYRVLLWNPPTIHAIDLFQWAERTYGVSMIMDDLSFNRQPFIDTATPESMLEGLSRTVLEGMMVRHTRGPAENTFNDMFHAYKQYDIDMIWVAGHVGCKNTMALNGMLREKCREKKIPLHVINYELLDPRIESRDGIITQCEHFMENVMGAKRRDH